MDDTLALQIAHALLDGFIATKDCSECTIPFAAELVKSLARTYEAERGREPQSLVNVVPIGRKR